MDNVDIACRLVGPEFAARKAMIVDSLFSTAAEVVELEDGFSFRFPSEAPWPASVMAFVEAERVCCPFLRFEIVFEPHHGPLWLTLRGSAQAKAFITDELALTPDPT